jgi:hypothetical protein
MQVKVSAAALLGQVKQLKGSKQAKKVSSQMYWQCVISAARAW